MKSLIFNADDLGLSEKTDEGILVCVKSGIVKSASLLINSKNAVKSFYWAKDLGCSIGLHLFGSTKKVKLAFENRQSLSNIELDTIIQEFDKQVKYFSATFKQFPSHVNFHHPLYWIPGFTVKYRKFAEKLNIPCRWFKDLGKTSAPHPANTVFDFYEKNSLTLPSLFKLINDVPEGITEFILHPGFYDPKMESSYKKERELQLNVLINPGLARFIKDKNIRLIDFTELK